MDRGFNRVAAVHGLACSALFSFLSGPLIISKEAQRLNTEAQTHVNWFSQPGIRGLSINVTLFSDFRIICLWDVRYQHLVVT